MWLFTRMCHHRFPSSLVYVAPAKWAAGEHYATIQRCHLAAHVRICPAYQLYARTIAVTRGTFTRLASFTSSLLMNLSEIFCPRSRIRCLGPCRILSLSNFVRMNVEHCTLHMLHFGSRLARNFINRIYVLCRADKHISTATDWHFFGI